MVETIDKIHNTDAGHIANAFTYQAMCLVDHLFSNVDLLKGISFFAHESDNDYRIVLKKHTIYAQVKHTATINTSSYNDVKNGLQTLKVNVENDSDSNNDEYFYVTTSRNLFAQEGKFFLKDKTYSKNELMNYLKGIGESLQKLTEITSFNENIFFKVLPFEGRDSGEKFKDTIRTVHRTLAELKIYRESDYKEVEQLVNKLINKFKTAIDGKSGIEIQKVELIADALNELMKSLININDYENNYEDNPLNIDVGFLDDFTSGDSKIFEIIYNYLNDFECISSISKLKRFYFKHKKRSLINFILDAYIEIESSIGFIINEAIKDEKLSESQIKDVKMFVFYIFAKKETYLMNAKEVI